MLQLWKHLHTIILILSPGLDNTLFKYKPKNIIFVSLKWTRLYISLFKIKLIIISFSNFWLVVQKIWKLTDSKKRKRQLDKQTNKIDRQTKHRQIDRHKHTYKESKTDRERTDREKKYRQTKTDIQRTDRQTDKRVQGENTLWG